MDDVCFFMVGFFFSSLLEEKKGDQHMTRKVFVDFSTSALSQCSEGRTRSWTSGAEANSVSSDAASVYPNASARPVPPNQNTSNAQAISPIHNTATTMNKTTSNNTTLTTADQSQRRRASRFSVMSFATLQKLMTSTTDDDDTDTNAIEKIIGADSRYSTGRPSELSGRDIRYSSYSLESNDTEDIAPCIITGTLGLDTEQLTIKSGDPTSVARVLQLTLPYSDIHLPNNHNNIRFSQSSNSSMGSSGADSATTTSSSPNLTTVTLIGTPIDYRAVDALSYHAPTLKRLHLLSTKFAGGGCDKILASRLQNLQTLTFRALPHTELGPTVTGVSSLGSLFLRNLSLETLVLHGTPRDGIDVELERALFHSIPQLSSITSATSPSIDSKTLSTTDCGGPGTDGEPSSKRVSWNDTSGSADTLRNSSDDENDNNIITATTPSNTDSSTITTTNDFSPPLPFSRLKKVYISGFPISSFVLSETLRRSAATLHTLSVEKVLTTMESAASEAKAFLDRTDSNVDFDITLKNHIE